MDALVKFYSHKPRLRVMFNWNKDELPRVGDIITIPFRLISERDKTYYKKNEQECPIRLKVKSREWLLQKCTPNYDMVINMEWTDDEAIKINKYLYNRHIDIL